MAFLAGMAEQIAEGLVAGSAWLLPLAFLGGLFTSLNPCAYPLIAAVAAYVWTHGDRRRTRAMLIAGAFVLGLALTHAVLGALGGLVGPLLGLTMRTWSIVIGSVFVIAGMLMAELIPINIGGHSLLGRYWERLHGLPGALLLGALLGLVATPCATPPLAAIVSLAASGQAVVHGALLLFTYAVGRAVPAVLIGLLASEFSTMERLAPHGRRLQIAGGWLIIIVGFYLIISA